jgi:hypothetical protein
MSLKEIKTKFISIFATSILVSTAFSNETKSTYNNTYVEAYLQLSGLDETALENFINEDNFKIGSDFVFNPAKQELRKINQSDVHDTTGKLNYKEVSVPNYVDAIKYFKISVENSMNPISAYAGNYIIQNFTSLQDEENLKLFKLFSDALYKQKIKICNAYLNQGEIYENGYFVNKDEKKALSIYKEGLQDKNCKSSWMNSVLTSKIIKLEKK